MGKIHDGAASENSEKKKNIKSDLCDVITNSDLHRF